MFKTSNIEDELVDIETRIQKLTKGTTFTLSDLYNIGYERETIVNGTGKVGVRGYVLDIFPIGVENPIRIEFWGDEIDNIKVFDMETQLSKEEINNIDIY